MADAYDREQTLKRGGGREFVPLHEAQAETAESLFQTRVSFTEALNGDWPPRRRFALRSAGQHLVRKKIPCSRRPASRVPEAVCV
jgi:hypothetical protein